MGTITFPTTETAGKVLQAELCGPDAKIRMFTTDHESAAVALSIDLAKLDDAERRRFDQVYDLPANAKRAIVCVVAKQSGLNGRGYRYVSLKLMSEEMGPYYNGGANAQLLQMLTPLRTDTVAGQTAAESRARAYSRKAVFA